MIGLTHLQAEVYEAARAYEREFDAEPFLIDIQQALNIPPHEVKTRVHRCIDKGFLCFDEDGRLIINEPPHERVMRIVCEQYGFTSSDILGSVRSLPLSAARRAIARRLNEQRYSISEIGEVIDRHASTVTEFLRPGIGQAKKARWHNRNPLGGRQCTA